MDIRDPLISGIYKITNIRNFKCYVGSAINIENRFTSHKKKLKYGKHPNKHLQSSYIKHGIDAFTFTVIEYCNNDQLLEREQYWINSLNCCDPKFGYNKRKIPNSNLGLRFTEEVNKKKGTPGHTFNKGRMLTLEHKFKISTKMKGIKHSPEHVEKRIASKRKPDKWPHGYACKCKPCMKLKSQAIRAKQIANAKEKSIGH